MDNIYIGAAYYPELWDESEVDKDIERCKALGINTLRVGEFAWGSMEPREGVFNLDWLIRVVDKLYAAGINTVMCTPTATPPRWMLNKYEQMRMVLSDLTRADVSSRCHICKTSPIAREKNRIIVTELAKAFASRPGVIGWQIDNELYPYWNDGCRCPLCVSAFHDFLREKFGTVEKLNKTWGMARWSLDYESFDAVEPPYPGQWRHPSLLKAWWDFQCRQIKTYSDEQADILHQYGCKNVGTDMMAHNDLSYYALNEKLDVVQFNHYETAAELANTAFSYDFLRCVLDKPFWVTETQVGWNGGAISECGYRPMGNAYANTMLPIARGAEMNEYWLFRAHPNGHEMAHGALYSAAGRPYRVSEEIARAAKDLEKCAEFFKTTKIESKIALHYSSTSASSFAAAPLLKGFDYRQTLIEKYYSAFRHYNIDVIDTPHSLDNYEVVISPFVATLDEHDFKARIKKFVESGGTWIVGPMTDIMDGDVTRYTTSPCPFLEEIGGAYVKYQKPIDNDVFKAAWKDGKHCDISTCFDALEPNDGTDGVVKYAGGEFGGLSVVTSKKVGKGRVILVGSVLGKSDLLKLTALPPIAKASDNVLLTKRSGDGGGIVAVETENKKGAVELDGEYIELISGKTVKNLTLKPYDVAILKRK